MRTDMGYWRKQRGIQNTSECIKDSEEAAHRHGNREEKASNVHAELILPEEKTTKQRKMSVTLGKGEGNRKNTGAKINRRDRSVIGRAEARTDCVSTGGVNAQGRIQ